MAAPNQSLTVLLVGLALVGTVVLLSSPNTQQFLTQNLGLQASAPTSPRPALSSDSKVEEVVVNKAIDGDTIELKDGRRIRYLNVDTPETVKQGAPVMCYGPEASAFNKQTMKEGRQIWMTSDKAKQDRYGRDLRFIFLEQKDTGSMEKSLNATLVKQGFGRARSYSPNTTYKKDFEKWQKEAEANKAGAWKSCPKPFVE